VIVRIVNLAKRSAFMSQEKYIGMDVHQATISAAVRDAQGKLIMECLLETKAATIVEFIQGLQGTLSLTFEEGTSAAWLHDLLKPHVSRLVVCDPRKNALLKEGNKSDRIDARKLAELLRTNQLNPVHHGEHGVRTLKELGRSYLTLTKDVTRVMNRIKALYRSWAIPCAGTSVYAPRHRAEWLAKIVEPGVRIRAQRLYQQLDSLQPVRLDARRELLVESHKHAAVKLVRQIPSIGQHALETVVDSDDGQAARARRNIGSQNPAQFTHARTAARSEHMAEGRLLCPNSTRQ
jgi:hypothetical protein